MYLVPLLLLMQRPVSTPGASFSPSSDCIECVYAFMSASSFPFPFSFPLPFLFLAICLSASTSAHAHLLEPAHEHLPVLFCACPCLLMCTCLSAHSCLPTPAHAHLLTSTCACPCHTQLGTYQGYTGT